MCWYSHAAITILNIILKSRYISEANGISQRLHDKISPNTRCAAQLLHNAELVHGAKYQKKKGL